METYPKKWWALGLIIEGVVLVGLFFVEPTDSGSDPPPTTRLVGIHEDIDPMSWEVVIYNEAFHHPMLNGYPGQWPVDS